MTVELAAVFFSRILSPSGTIQVRWQPPNAAWHTFTDDTPDRFLRAAEWIQGRTDVHLALCTYEKFDGTNRTKREPQYHTGNGARCVVVDVDDKDNGGVLKDQTHEQLAARLRVKPDLIVRSGGGGFHAYWVADQDLTQKQFSELRAYLLEMVREAYVPDDRAGSYPHDTIRCPYTRHPSNNWCYVEADYGTCTLNSNFVEHLPLPTALTEFFPNAQRREYPVEYPSIKLVPPVIKFTNEQLRSCAAYASIQDDAHVHSGHMVDLFYLSWVNNLIGDPDQLFDDYILNQMSACNTEDHYRRQWASMKPQQGIRCATMQSTTAGGCCVGCPMEHNPEGSPARLALQTKVIPIKPVADAPQAPASVTAVIPSHDYTELPYGYYRDGDSIMHRGKTEKDKPSKICSHFEIVSVTEHNGIDYLTLRCDERLFARRVPIQEMAFRKMLESLTGVHVNNINKFWYLFNDWHPTITRVPGAVVNYGWQEDGSFATYDSVIDGSGQAYPSVLVNDDHPSQSGTPNYADCQERLQSIWPEICDLIGSHKGHVHRVSLLTVLASALCELAKPPDGLWLSWKGATGTGKSTALALCNWVYGNPISKISSTTIAAIENDFHNNGALGLLLDEVEIRDSDRAEVLLSLLSGATTNRSTRAGQSNQQMREWRNYAVFCSNRGLHCRMLEGDSHTTLAARARIIELVADSGDLKGFPILQRLNKREPSRGALGVLFSAYITVHADELRERLDRLITQVSSGRNEKRFGEKWMASCIVASEVLGLIGFAIPGVTIESLLAELGRDLSNHSVQLMTTATANPMQTITGLLTSKRVVVVDPIAVNLPQTSKAPVFRARGYLYIPVSTLAEARSNRPGWETSDALTESEITTQMQHWSADRRQIIFRSSHAELMYDCLVVEDAEIPDDSPILIQKTWRELHG